MQQPRYQDADPTTPEDQSLDESPRVTVAPQAIQSAQDTAAPLSASAERSAQAVKRRPIARYVGIGVALILVVALGYAAVFSIQKAQRAAPTTLELYPGATLLSEKKTPNSDERIYAVTDLPDKVNEFYTRQFGSTEESGCKRIFTVYIPNTDPQGEPIPSLKPGDSYYKCAMDTSMLEQVQIATLTITYRPAVRGSEIKINRSWGNSGK